MGEGAVDFFDGSVVSRVASIFSEALSFVAEEDFGVGLWDTEEDQGEENAAPDDEDVEAPTPEWSVSTYSKRKARLPGRELTDEAPYYWAKDLKNQSSIQGSLDIWYHLAPGPRIAQPNTPPSETGSDSD